MNKQSRFWLPILLVGIATISARAQSFRVQCPTSTITHPSNLTNVNAEPAYTGPTTLGTGSGGYLVPSANVNGAIKCQQIAGGDGFATMGDGTQTYMFSFGPLSGLADIAAGQPGTEPPVTFNTVSPNPLKPGDPATTNDAGGAFTWNGAVGLMGDPDVTVPTPGGVTALGTATVAGGIIEDVTITNAGNGYLGPATVTFDPPSGCTPSATCQTALGNVIITGGKVTSVDITFAGEGYTTPPGVTFSAPITGCTGRTLAGCIDGHVDPRPIMDVGVMNGNIPAPLMALDEDDEFFLTLTNVGMIMRPDLFEQHTVHFHGYPNASTFYDGVPDASVAINIGGSFTYYYLAPDAGTYFWHCHITPPEHLQMGMVGQIYVRPRQNRWSGDLYAGLQQQKLDLRTKCDSASDILCSNPLPVVNTGASNDGTKKYAYNDGDGSTAYDVEYPIQIHGFDPNFHFVGMTFNPEAFADMKDKFFLLNGRSYPDTVTAGPMQTQTTDGSSHFSQPLPSIINIPAGGRALLRISDLDVTEYQTLASVGIPMQVIALNAKLLRDQAGNNLYYNTNSITLGGGESLDVILDTCAVARDSSGNCSTPMAAGTYYLYTPNLDHLSNDAENFGGLMTEVHVCSSVTGGGTFGNQCVN
ncbi:MAG TPA: multicopper oxidase domain-containing protein [Candidatus Binatia bacterium]|nr:multicopper oxidase domain-containing protein [Candidatus Binatia bacterium]